MGLARTRPALLTIDDAHHAQLAEGVNYAALADTTRDAAGELPGQLDLLTDLDPSDEATPGETHAEVAL